MSRGHPIFAAPTMGRTLLTLLLMASAARWANAQPDSGDILPLSEVRAGQTGEVWTVFQGTTPEPFSVEVTGVIRNALGPGKSIILCRLTDPRVQGMGAVAGMSGSPLYIGGRFAGALSYQLQQFETVRFAGFTPAADMSEVSDRVAADGAADPSPVQTPTAGGATATGASFRPMRQMFALGGVSPRTAAIMAPRYEALGLGVSALGGSSQGQDGAAAAAAASTLRPGDAVSVALSTGDVTLAGTGTVSRVDGNRVVAFGHPMLGLGDVQLPMCSADVVAILPSTLESMKVANIGPVIGCISQDRLSAVSGTLGPGPEMTDVEVDAVHGSAQRTIRFRVVREKQVAPMIMLTGVVEAVFGSNDSEFGEGFRVESTLTFSPTQELTRESVYAGQQGFVEGMVEFLSTLSAELQNPFEKALPSRVLFRIEPLGANPEVTVERFDLSRTTVRAGETLQATIGWRNFQGGEETKTIDVPIDPSWAGKTLGVIAAPGRVLDELTGHGHVFRPGQLRSFGAYLEGMRDSRPQDGICIAVVERSALFFDQARAAQDTPASIERIAVEADPVRYRRQNALVPLWETHLLPGKVSAVQTERTLRVLE